MTRGVWWGLIMAYLGGSIGTGLATVGHPYFGTVLAVATFAAGAILAASSSGGDR